VIIKSTDGASAGILIVDTKVDLSNFTLQGNFDLNNIEATNQKTSKSTWGFKTDSSKKSGVFVVSTEANGPFEKAGITTGMEILSIDGHKTGAGPEAHFLRDLKAVGSHFKVTARSGSALKDFDVVTQSSSSVVAFSTGLALIRFQGTLKNITIKNFPGSGINSYGPRRKSSVKAESERWRGENLNVSKCGFNGIAITDAPIIQTSKFLDNRNYGVLVNISNYETYESSDSNFYLDQDFKEIEANGNQLGGFHFNDNATGRLNNCKARFNKHSGLSIKRTFSESQQPSSVSGVTIYGGEFTSNNDYGVSAEDRGKILLRSNTFLDGNIKGKTFKSQDSQISEF
jgi:hypothetical protein